MSDFALDDLVHVYAFRRRRLGRVVRVTPTRVCVRYVTPKGKKAEREVWFKKVDVARRV